MNSLIIPGAGVLIVGFVVWLAVWNARRQGAAEQRAKDILAGSNAEFDIHQAQAEQRDTTETRTRTNDGTF